MQKIFSTVLMLAFLSACSTSSIRNSVIDTTKISPKNSDEYYLALQKRASEDDVTLDFAELRQAFSQSSFYQPYASDERKSVENAFVLSSKNKAKECLQAAATLLDKNYISLGGHYVSAVCARELNLDDQAYLHEEILEGLLDSISDSGDGKTVETAFLTYTTEELYTYLQLSGLKVKNQNIINENNRVYDAMQVSPNGLNEEFTLYFDVTTQWKKGLQKN